MRDHCLPLLAVRVITKTLLTHPYVTGSTIVYSVATVAAVKWWISSFECHTSEFHLFSLIFYWKEPTTDLKLYLRWNTESKSAFVNYLSITVVYLYVKVEFSNLIFNLYVKFLQKQIITKRLDEDLERRLKTQKEKKEKRFWNAIKMSGKISEPWVCVAGTMFYSDLSWTAF